MTTPKSLTIDGVEYLTNDPENAAGKRYQITLFCPDTKCHFLFRARSNREAEGWRRHAKIMKYEQIAVKDLKA